MIRSTSERTAWITQTHYLEMFFLALVLFCFVCKDNFQEYSALYFTRRMALIFFRINMKVDNDECCRNTYRKTLHI